jgi:hypothetical protein
MRKPDAARYLRVSLGQLQMMMKQKQISYETRQTPNGPVTLFDKAEVERVERQRKEGNAPIAPEPPPIEAVPTLDDIEVSAEPPSVTTFRGDRLTKAETAAALGFSIRHLQRIMAAGKIAFVKAHGPRGDILLFDRTEVERFKQDRIDKLYAPLGAATADNPAGQGQTVEMEIGNLRIILRIKPDFVPVSLSR